MYTPARFTETDRETMLDFIEEYGFATLLSWSDSQPMVSHIPLLVDRGVPGKERLLGHVARANEHWRLFDDRQPALAIFHGPHGYISPAWYTNHPLPPTWNYAVVHAHGTPRTLDADATLLIIRRLVEKYETNRVDRWDGNLPPEYVANSLRSIVGFELPIDRLEGKFKLSQNREEADLAGALTGLERQPDYASRELAEFMRRYYTR